MKTRNDYISGKCTHREYYAQFVTSDIKAAVENKFTKARLIEAFKQDEHFNTIPLHQWDNLTYICRSIGYMLKQAGDSYTLSSGVCILKAAARIIATE